MSNIIFSARMIEGELHLSEEDVSFEANRKARDKGLAPQVEIPLSAIAGLDFKPGSFAAGGYINITFDEGLSLLALNFTLAQSANAAIIVGGIEKRRVALRNPVLVTAKGVNGQLELLEDRVRIKREGGMAFISQGFKGDKEIQLSSISSIQLRVPGGMTNGYIQFAFTGGQESKAALFQATQDENSIMFSQAQLPAFLQIKEAIEKQRTKISSPALVHSSSGFGIDDLEKLASLRDRGIVTEEEFQAKKKQILGL